MTLAPTIDEPEVLYWLALDQITVLPQIRTCFDDQSIADLATNIREIGMQQPVICQLVDNRYILLDGERRYRAAPLAGLKRIPARVITDPLTAANVLAIQLSTSLQRQDLNIVDRAEGIRRFMGQTGHTAEQAAARLGLSAPSVCRALAVLRLPEPLKQKAAAGDLTVDAAYLLVRVADAHAQADLAERFAKGELTREQLAHVVRAQESGKTRAAVRRGPDAAPSPTPSKVPTWRMTRSIGPGVALAVSGGDKGGSLGRWRFNPISHELSRKGEGAGSVEAVVGMYSAILDLIDRAGTASGSPGRESEAFWRQSTLRMVRMFVGLLVLSLGTVRIDDLYQAILSSPRSRDEASSEGWKRSYCYRLLLLADEKPKSPEARREFSRIADYILRELPQTPEKTRGSILAMFSAMSDCLQSGAIHEIFGQDSTFTPLRNGSNPNRNSTDVSTTLGLVGASGGRVAAITQQQQHSAARPQGASHGVLRPLHLHLRHHQVCEGLGGRAAERATLGHQGRPAREHAPPALTAIVAGGAGSSHSCPIDLNPQGVTMSHVYAHVVKHAFEHSKTLHHVGAGKNPLVAFVAGFLFGPFGVGFYLRSWADCFIPLALIILGSTLTAGIAAPLLWILCGAWGWVRVTNSNRAAGELPAA